MDKKDIQKIVKDIFVKPLKDKAEMATGHENLEVEEKTAPKKGNMRKGKK